MELLLLMMMMVLLLLMLLVMVVVVKLLPTYVVLHRRRKHRTVKLGILDVVDSGRRRRGRVALFRHPASAACAAAIGDAQIFRP